MTNEFGKCFICGEKATHLLLGTGRRDLCCAHYRAEGHYPPCRCEETPGRCEKCGREKIRTEKAVTGFPNFHIAGTRVDYCGFCDDPPVLTLGSGSYPIVLDPNDAPASP